MRRRLDAVVWVDGRNVYSELPDLGARREVGLVTVVGSGLGHDLAQVAALDALLAPWSEQAGSEADAAWWQVPSDAVDDAVRAAHTLCQ